MEGNPQSNLSRKQRIEVLECPMFFFRTATHTRYSQECFWLAEAKMHMFDFHQDVVASS